MSRPEPVLNAKTATGGRAQRSTPVGRRRRYQTFGWLLISAGWAAGLGGWVGVQSTDVVAVQLAYLASGGLAGIALVVMGIGLQTADDVRTSREILEDLQDRMEDLEIGLDGVVARLPRFPRTEERETR